MNFQNFYGMCEETDFDEIKVIGKEIEKEGKRYHVIGMTLKKKKARLHVLEEIPGSRQEQIWKEKTPRESLKESIHSEEENSFFLHIRELKIGNKSYEIDGAVSGAITDREACESSVFFMKMYQAGWNIQKDSYFYQVFWENIRITNLELREEMDALPEWKEEIVIVRDTVPGQGEIEIPFWLECGKKQEIEFTLKDGRTAVCYIEKTEVFDVWKEQEKHFKDPEYRKHMLMHMSEEELEQMKEQCFETLQQHCPKGKQFMLVEYECSENVSLSFYAKDYLDTLPEPRKGSASAIFMTHRPEKKVGEHGFKFRGCIIQQPLEKGCKKVEAELFSYTYTVEQREEIL